MSLPVNRHDPAYGSRRSTNNPFSDPHSHPVQVTGTTSNQPHEDGRTFLSFTAKDATTVPETGQLKRRWTRTKPVNVDEFKTAFEEEQPLRTRESQRSLIHRRKPSESGSVLSLSSSAAAATALAYVPSYPESFEDVDYSDTARLTVNAAPPARSRSPTQRTSRKSYEPAPVEPVEDYIKQTAARTQQKQRQSLRRVATVIRRMSRRVVNVQNTNNSPHIPAPTASLIEERDGSIPMTPTSTITSSHLTNLPLDQMDSSVKTTERQIPLRGKSCGIFGPNNWIRKGLARMLCWKWTETVIMLLIALHAIVLLIIGWGSDEKPEPPNTWGETWDQYVLLGIFSCYTPKENDEKQFPLAFLRHSWNRVDLISVVSYWIDFALLCTGQAIIGETRRIMVFKMMSAIILLRLLNITNDPSDPGNIEVLQQYCGGYIDPATGKVEPFLLKDGRKGLWSKGFICPTGLVCQETENPFGNTISFDNIFSSLLVVMIIAGDQTWTDRMYDMMDAEYVVACLYFIIIVIVLNFWLINLFVAVINEMFAKVREDSQHSAFTTSTARPVLADAAEGGWSIGENNNGKPVIRESCLAAVMLFTRPFWIFLVAVNLMVMASKTNDMSPEQLAVLDDIEFAFTIAFAAEILLRLLTQRRQMRKFFSDKMNRTDFLLAVATCIIWIPPIRANRYAYAWLTGFQVLRIYRIVVAIPRLRTLMSRVLGSVHGLINLIFFIVMATLLCAIIAFQLFEGVLNDSDEEMRFFSVYNSFAALYQLFSGEDWTTVLYAAMEAGAPSGNSAVHALFLVLWFAFSNFVMVNMFIAVLMENFETAEEEKRQRQVQHYVEKTETAIVDDDTIVSRWNLYRYFKPHPKGLDVKNIPTNLVLLVQKTTVRDFMNDAAIDRTYLARKNEANQRSQATELTGKGRWGKVRRFLSTLLSPPSSYGPSSLNGDPRKSINVDSLGAFEHYATFYDSSKGLAEANEPRSLRFLLDPTLRETSASRAAEAARHDIEERKALQQEFITAHPSYDKSLYIFSPGNRIRHWCQLLVPASRGERMFGTSPSRRASLLFSVFIVCCVITNVVLTIYNSPVYQFQHRDNPAQLRMLIYVDWVFMIIFSVEFVIKIIADGLLMTPNAYLLNGWNVLDLFVLITLYMSNFGRFAASTGLERAFRAFKALRALRLINLLHPAKETFTAILATGLPRILDAGLLGLFLIIPFALYGQNIFMGLFYKCNDENESITGKSMCIGEAMIDMQEPMPDGAAVYKPRIWDNPYVYSFDSFSKSLLVLFEIASGEGWVDVMETSMSLGGKDQSPRQDASQLWGIFFMVYNLAGSVFVISLFLGVVLENFAKRNGTAYLTADQRRWLDLKKLLSQMRPAKRPKQVPEGRIRRKCFDLVVEKRGKFYKFMTVVIVLNILLLCTDTDYDDKIEGLTQAKGYLYLCFIFIYWLEITIKILGLGWSSFRRNLWNLYDLVVVLGSAITVIATLGSHVHQINVESQKLFMTALCFKLVQRSDSLNQLFTTMAASAYQIVNVFAVWFVVMTTYAIMFMEIFGLTKYGTQATTEHVNFRSYANTMISLVRYSTGEAWNTVMHDFTVEYPNCVVADNFLDSDCGSLRWAYFLFLTFNIISMYIFTAIFVAVVADNFSYVYQIAANFSLVNRDEIRKYPFICKVWAEYDAERTGYIGSKNYVSFWRRLDGMFNVRIYDRDFSYKSLASQCGLEVQIGDASDDPYRIRIDMAALNDKLNMLDKVSVHKRKRDLNMLYWEAAMTETPKGVSFNQMLLMLARQKLIVPENALLLEELLANREKEEAIQTLINIDRIRGMMETIAMRKKFLQHIASKKNSHSRELPSIVVEHDPVSRLRIRTDTSPVRLSDIPPTPTTPLSEFGLFDADDMSPRSSSFPSPTAEHPPNLEFELENTRHNEDESFEMWQDMLQQEIK
ncbi:calcium channel protein [Apophysomyces ossiformis]|uniref:Calcium-channel protein CCH1 n=1 Tax=Apophysomyces ossiformis TaxID=679940 RepID=A0A8H7BRE3_9FUNG|nr:calcium channel protein [Apophysomyces ossiformis]